MTLPAVWLLHTNDIPAGSDACRALGALLSEDERARQQRYRSSDARHQFLLSRVLLRRVLGSISGERPRSLQFHVAKSGKPQLVQEPELRFSLSHSGQWIALTVSCETDIGVDIEQPVRPRNFLGIANQYFHPDEQSLLTSSPPELLPVHFYRLWTMKEAFFKSRGTGLSEGLSRINLAGFHLGQAIQFAEDLPGASEPWQFHYAMLPLPDANHLHLAVAGTDVGIGEIGQERILRGLPEPT
ncbi:4'-phosphopantetheinyl transferase superfamily protein [Microbulbifer elongatus]|uniref:4'-phosphopantetheinyl transferase superfamily protein n=1 Tax=Microbulbifer elongatus TaxID=86173 RepID=A0ABT1P413_9GAMM|nr:4'-phosphopantetheinyl transferase superfamily protein [Microbulbifer elongatus]MCQ3830855.1 4'-phosphopantetheinyl transferase superfamily protein [Microbulbifer elongatus]